MVKNPTLGQKVFFLDENKVQTDFIASITTVSKLTLCLTGELRVGENDFDKEEKIQFETFNELVSQSDYFDSKEELLASL